MSLVVLGSSPSTSNIPMNLCCPFHFSCWKNILLAASLSHFQDAPHLIYAPSLRCVSMSKISFCTAVIKDFMVIKASSVFPQGPVRSLLTRSSWIIVACLSFCSALSFLVMRLVFFWLPYPRATPLIAKSIYSNSWWGFRLIRRADCCAGDMRNISARVWFSTPGASGCWYSYRTLAIRSLTFLQKSSSLSIELLNFQYPGPLETLLKSIFIMTGLWSKLVVKGLATPTSSTKEARLVSTRK